MNRNTQEAKSMAKRTFLKIHRTNQKLEFDYTDYYMTAFYSK